MTIPKSKHTPRFGRIRNTDELGRLIRDYRINQNITLKKASGITRLGMRFLSELERGKETAQLGKAMLIINQLGLEIIIQPRGFSNPIPKVLLDQNKRLRSAK